MAQFYPLDHIDASINLWKLEETYTENKVKQDAWVETPSPEPPGNEGFVLSSLDFSLLRGGEVIF